ncbi:hypothetical protein ACMA1D_20760 [Streptomyces sp. 796.1]|uniref:hypothetical protein n=1 Tax=Streptomyces sp. 796.1 TaxID=3163029 RepID=UPI0039C8F919
MRWLAWRRRGAGRRRWTSARRAEAAARAGAAAAGLEPGEGEARSLVFHGDDAEQAKRYLLGLPPIEDRRSCYLVRTPDSTWGRDAGGLYLERLRPWQCDPSRARCWGTVMAVAGLQGVLRAARGQGDNFVAQIACGRCAHEWFDGLRYQNLTAVRCPDCQTLNRVDTSCIRVDPD